MTRFRWIVLLTIIELVIWLVLACRGFWVLAGILGALTVLTSIRQYRAIERISGGL